jgi:MFS superfamily sulfate permease-like transporter
MKVKKVKNTKKPITDFQSSYQAMVDSVEEFVVKEGKTLQQAFHSAEEKLHDAKELSKEKIKQASKDLKNNLRLWSDAVEGASEAYKEQIKFDLAYVNNSIWSKFQSIANSNTVELMEFTRTLKEKAQSVRTEDHLVAHQEHHQWDSEHALWLDEIALWQSEHDKALTKLAEIEKALKQQSRSLHKHGLAIQAHAKLAQEHEKIMSNAEQDPSSEVFEEADEKEIAAHEKERQLHCQESELHHSLKTRHFKIMAMINMLYKESHRAE